MDFDQTYNQFDNHMFHVEKLAFSTRRGYLRRTEQFMAYLVDNGFRDTTEITAQLAVDFMEDTYANLGDGTYNLYTIQLRQFLKFLREQGALGADQAPERYLKRRRRPQPTRVKQFIQVEDVEALAQAARDWHPRDEYIIRCLSGMARRAGELCSMDVGDVDLNPRGNAEWGIFRFTNIKTGRRRYLPIQESLQPHLAEWFRIYERLIGRPLDPADPLFPALQRGKGRSYRGMRHPLILNPAKRLPYDSLQDVLKRAGASSAHPFRRGMLVDLKDRHGIRVAMVYADHAKEETTELYMDERREIDNLGKLLSKEAAAKKAAEEVPQALPETVMPAGVTSLTERRARSGRAS
jgi:integrase